MNNKRFALLIFIFFFFIVHPASAQQSFEEVSGDFADGTRWLAKKPGNWNGYLLLDLDAAGFGPPGRPVRPNPFNEWLLEQGYALGGTNRGPVGYDFPKAAERLVRVRTYFSEKWSEPKRTLAIGGSRGAFVVRMSLELYPNIFDGGMMSAGGGAGEIAVLNNKLNSLFVLKTLVDPNAPLTLVNVDVQKENTALRELVTNANATPQGRARLSFAAAVAQFALWSSRGKPKPATTDYDAILDQIVENFAFATAVPVRGGVEAMAGGNVSWNTGVDYVDLLKRSGRQTMVETLYKKAGLNLADDLKILAKAPRISANPGAVRRAEPMMTYTGKIQDPLVNVDNDDPVDPASDKLAYLQTLKNANTDHLFNLLWADRPGHGGQSNLDRAIGFTLLIERIETGKWSDTSVENLKNIGDKITNETEIDLGEFSLFDPGELPKPLNTWDSSNWGSYQP